MGLLAHWLGRCLLHCHGVSILDQGASVERVVGGIAAGVGHVLRLVALLLGLIPDVAGPVFLFYGAWQIYRPAAWIVAGVLMISISLWRGSNRGRRSR